MMNTKPDYTAADALTDALLRAGVTHVFLNSGTDYPPILESWAKSQATDSPLPEIVISPHEFPAMSAAQGFAQITGNPQAVFVHVDVGTQNLGGAVHNAFRCRVPVFILAGLSPFTIEGEMKGGRNAQIQFLQNTADQSSIVRPYVKMEYEYRTGLNIQQMTYRALQIAKSEPQGPVYLTAAREVLESPGTDCCDAPPKFAAVSPTAPNTESLQDLRTALLQAERPLIITSYSGRNPECVSELAAFSEMLAIPVVEQDRVYLNFPYSHPLHLGFDSHDFIGDADFILVLDCDLPWIPAQKTPKPDCQVFCVDTDPIKEGIPLWYIGAERFIRADSRSTLRLLNEMLSDESEYTPGLIQRRRERASKLHAETRHRWRDSEPETEEYITPGFLTSCIKAIISEDTVIVNETISHRASVDRLLNREKAGTLFTSGGSALGWHGGAAFGMKLACPEKDIVALTGDGSYIFSNPSAVYWMAARYNAPFMTVIYNNSGWGAPKLFTVSEHPGGYADSQNSFWASFNPPSALDKIAEAAGGAYARTVREPSELMNALTEGRAAVQNGKCAVINVMLPPV